MTGTLSWLSGWLSGGFGEGGGDRGSASLFAHYCQLVITSSGEDPTPLILSALYTPDTY